MCNIMDLKIMLQIVHSCSASYSFFFLLNEVKVANAERHRIYYVGNSRAFRRVS